MADHEGIISKYNNMPVKVRKQYYNYEDTAKELKKKFDGMNKLIDMNLKMREEIGEESYYHNAEKEVDQEE